MGKLIEEITKRYGEKAGEYELFSQNKMTAYGVDIVSRYHKVSELIEMLAFVEALSKTNACLSVDSVYYDSKCCACFITITPSARGDVVEDLIYACAMQTISQFEWKDSFCHGLPLQDETQGKIIQ